MKQSYIRGADLVGFRVRMVRDARGVVRLAGEEDEGEVLLDEPLGDYLKRLARGTAEPPPSPARSRSGILLYTWDELEALVGELLRSFDHVTPALLRALSDRHLARLEGAELMQSDELTRLLQLGERELLARGYTVASSPFDQVL